MKAIKFALIILVKNTLMEGRGIIGGKMNNG